MRVDGRTYSPADRVVCWFSAGATSAIATWIAVQEYGRENLRVVYCDTGSEHSDNKRFLRDVEKWIDHPIEILKNEKYEDIWDVFHKTGWLVGPAGARCTLELKKAMRQQFEDYDDIQVFGFEPKERSRAEKFINNNPECKLWAPLIEREITKPVCKRMIERAGIDLPAMYQPQKSGSPYDHNNCIGCVKGQMGYWNKIRIDFPEVFNRMARTEREIGAAVCKTYAGDGERKPVYLDELEPSAGRYKEEPPMSCDMLCDMEADDQIAQYEPEHAEHEG